MRRLICATLLFVLFLSGAQPQEELTSLSLTISGKLVNLKQEITSLQTDLNSTTQQLQTALTNLQLSQEEQQKWETTSTQLSSSLDSINKKLNDSYNLISSYKVKVTRYHWLIAIGFILLLLKIVAVVLWIKKISVPRVVDIIL